MQMVKHIIHDINGKNIMERAIQYIKDRTECFDDNFPYMKDNCKSMLQNGLNYS
ncbi:MAG: hypothetical protein KatS3mg003_1916 [Candidatus Nitrosocaldaceae archaeon]|nr:MAG: hypothetical protein KatS3mg003_1916 [Candidatus Nitrosocaldaceae archaeon]